jgi:hypothetical protein
LLHFRGNNKHFCIFAATSTLTKNKRGEYCLVYMATIVSRTRHNETLYVVTTQMHCVYCAVRTAYFYITEGRLSGRQETKKIQQVKLTKTCHKNTQQQDAKSNADLKTKWAKTALETFEETIRRRGRNRSIKFYLSN